MFGNTTLFCNRENATLQCRRFRNIATISQPCHKPNYHALSRPHINQQFIRFPLDIQQLHKIKANFMAIAGMPGVVGVIDGTHIKIIAPSNDEDVFVNRKKVHSINTQVVFDSNFNIAYWMLLQSSLELPMIRAF